MGHIGWQPTKQIDLCFLALFFVHENDLVLMTGFLWHSSFSSAEREPRVKGSTNALWVLIQLQAETVLEYIISLWFQDTSIELELRLTLSVSWIAFMLQLYIVSIKDRNTNSYILTSKLWEVMIQYLIFANRIMSKEEPSNTKIND